MVCDHIARNLRRYQQLHNLSQREFAQYLDIPIASLVNYLSGKTNPRATTIGLIAEKLGMSVAELVSSPPLDQEWMEIIIRAAKKFSTLSVEKQQKCVQLLYEIAILFSETD